MYRIFATDYHWPPPIVNKLSFPQIKMYLNSGKKIVRLKSMAEAHALIAQIKGEQ